ncbi:hypothetical protein [Caenimonas sp. SL110]|uniref:hypothetical protein n=1 Tax=Caenimonas sp. SL110 TaxID=1450524 RepID=UPI0006532190|nr:hypothetical protein [Caenimonas sp. SL110]
MKTNFTARSTHIRQPVLASPRPQGPTLDEAKERLKILRDRLIAQETLCTVLSMVSGTPGSMAASDLQAAQTVRDSIQEQVITLEHNIERVQSGLIDKSRVFEGL